MSPGSDKSERDDVADEVKPVSGGLVDPPDLPAEAVSGEGHEPIIVPETPEDVREERVLLDRALGGRRGIIDSGAPTVVFVIVYLATGNDLGIAIWSALGAGAAIALWRLVRRESLQQIMAGLIGVGISAFVASRTQTGEGYFIPGLLQNIGYGLAFLISILVGWPLIGVIIGFLTGQGVRWRADPELRRIYAAASWIWVGLFALRVAVQGPLYLAGWVGALGFAKVIMGVPLFIAAGYFTYLVLRPVFERRRAAGSPDG
ncbi:MAG: DUF3159 domain-containing protein [Candidatus Nanopelagicales bacterium]